MTPNQKSTYHFENCDLWHPTMIGRATQSNEHESNQSRAEQYKTGNGDYWETVGGEFFTHWRTFAVVFFS